MKIIRLQAENVKKLVAIDITPDGSMVVIGGRNGAGKTSVIDSIAYLLGGKSLIPDQPIRKGEAKATITADLGEYKVERTFTEKGSYLRISDADGNATSSPQKLLDRIFNKHSADPLAFSIAEPRKQAELLRKITGVDTTELDKDYESIYEDRRLKGREILEPVKPDFPRPQGKVSVAILMEELERRQAINTGNALKRADLTHAIEDFASFEKSVGDILDQIDLLKKKLKEANQGSEEAQDRVQDLDEIVNALVDQNEGVTKQQIENADNENAAVRAWDRYSDNMEAVQKLKHDYRLMTSKLTEIDKKKSDMIASAKFPVEGLGFSDGGVTFNNLPLDQASGAERLRVSVAMALATNPELRVVLIRDGSLLDDDSLKMIHQMTAEAGAQIWIERVGDGDECSVIIEEGEIREAKPDTALPPITHRSHTGNCIVNREGDCLAEKEGGCKECPFEKLKVDDDFLF